VKGVSLISLTFLKVLSFYVLIISPVYLSLKLPDYIDASQLVSLGMAPTFMTRYISDSDGATSPSGRRGRQFRHGTCF
jgi:hypothetical protein